MAKSGTAMAVVAVPVCWPCCACMPILICDLRIKFPFHMQFLLGIGYE